jgi:hypothetical protein
LNLVTIHIVELGTPSAEPKPSEPCDYDSPQFGDNGNGVIEKADAVDAIMDYFGEVIDKPLVVQVIIYFFMGTRRYGHIASIERSTNTKALLCR